MIIYSLTRHVAGATSLALAFLLICAATPALKYLGTPADQETGGFDQRPIRLLNKIPGVPLVLDNFNSFSRLWIFGPAALKPRMMLVTDPSVLTEYGNNVTLATEAVAHDLHVPDVQYKDFIRLHSKFLVLAPSWLTVRLLHDGMQMRLVGTVSSWYLYYVTRPTNADR